MYWLDGLTFDDNLMNNSFLSADSNGELSDNTHRLSKASTSSGHRNTNFRSSNRKTQNLRGLAATTKAKRRRHAHYKLNTRLDRKSSRGMIYENEELRLRTININAEVERGQTDIKRLRKENEQLRREIWTLRDECDRLNKRVKAKFIEQEQGAYNARCSGGNECPYACNEGGGCEVTHSRCNSEDSDSCDSCCCHDKEEIICNDECCSESKQLSKRNECLTQPTDSETSENVVTSVTITTPTSTNKLTNFDHLSVVSEETLSNSEVVLAQQTENLLGYTPDIGSSQTTLPSLMGPLTPLTPIEMVANELNDLQAVVPPLSYFENIVHQHMNTNYGNTPESTSTTNSGKTIVKHTNGWDYNLESPFAQRRYQVNSVSPIMTKRSPAQNLTTFVPTTTVTPQTVSPNRKPAVPKKPIDLGSSIQQNLIIETVPITTMPPNGGLSQQASTAATNDDNNGNMTPKHFFAPIKPKLKLNTALANQKRIPPPLPPVINESVNQAQSLEPQQKCEPPDIYVTNGLATPYRPPNKPTVQPPPIPQRLISTSTTMQAQTDSANLESILNDIEAISEDILAIQLVKNKSREKLDNNKSTESVNTTETEPLQQDNKHTKPYKSEMNLLLTYEDNNPTIKPALPVISTINNTETVQNSNIARRTRSLEREHTDSPSPNIPDPMKPFPDNRKYIGFDRLNKTAIIATTTTGPEVAATATQTSPVLNSPTNQKAHLPLSPLVTNVGGQKAVNGKSFPPTPPVRQYPSPLNIKCAGVVRSNSVIDSKTSRNENDLNSPVLAGVSPNKSQLYSALANAAAKRAQFRSQPTHLTKSLDNDFNVPDNTKNSEMLTGKEEKEIMENGKRKGRRVSIVCADTDSPGTPDKPIPTMRTQLAADKTAASGSCLDLHSVLPNPALRNLKETSQSTPNSPHSSRKYENSTLAATPVPPTISVTPTSTPQHQPRNSSSVNSTTQVLSYNHGHSNSYPNVVSPLTQLHQQTRKNSQDAIKASAADIACAAANAMRSKCSRRHSDGTVSHSNQRISNTSGGTNGTHHHHPHNHHHHQHSSSLVSQTNPHHSHHSRQDSNHETVASYSDRNSNSLASSRESSASFSLRSQRRKLSVSSHTGGKIPWCGCWGNGCL